MTNLIDKIRQLFQKSQSNSQIHTMSNSSQIQGAHKDDAAALNAAIVKNLMDLIEHTHEGMYTCGETFALLDEYVELIADDGNDQEAAALMPYVKNHLEKCPDCHSVYAALLEILQSEPPSTEPAP